MTRTSALGVLLIGVLGLSAVACDDKHEGPPISPSPNPPPAPAFVSLTLTGNLNLSAVGETSQLTATAGYSDGTTKDVSRESRWSVNDQRVATVAADGLLSVVGLGRSSVSVRNRLVVGGECRRLLLARCPAAATCPCRRHQERI